jgi:hypothetical protein
MNDLTLPYLYRTVDLYVGDDQPPRLSIFTADLSGLQHIRTLRIKAARK